MVEAKDHKELAPIEAKIAYYQRQNAEQIMNAQARKVCQMVKARYQWVFVAVLTFFFFWIK